MLTTSEARQRVVAVMQAVERPSRVPGATIKEISFGKNGSVVKGNVHNVTLRTYGGVAGWSWTVREHGQFSRRTHYVWWLAKAELQPVEWEAGTLTACTVTGNPSKNTFKQLSKTHAIVVEGLDLS